MELDVSEALRYLGVGGGAPEALPLALCVVFTFIWARIAAGIANRASAKALNRATGVILVVLGVLVLGFSFIK